MSRGSTCGNGDKESEGDGAGSSFLDQFWLCPFRGDSLGISQVQYLRNGRGKMFPRNRQFMGHTRAQTVTFTTDWSIHPTWEKGTAKKELKDYIENFKV